MFLFNNGQALWLVIGISDQSHRAWPFSRQYKKCFICHSSRDGMFHDTSVLSLYQFNFILQWLSAKVLFSGCLAVACWQKLSAKTQNSWITTCVPCLEGMAQMRTIAKNMNTRDQAIIRHKETKKQKNWRGNPTPSITKPSSLQLPSPDMSRQSGVDDHGWERGIDSNSSCVQQLIIENSGTVSSQLDVGPTLSSNSRAMETVHAGSPSNYSASSNPGRVYFALKLAVIALCDREHTKTSTRYYFSPRWITR